MSVRTRRLLILACSRRKRLDESTLPAIERYDGPAFRVLRRYLATQPLDAPEVLVLSAEFGLIAGTDLIPLYDRVMTRNRAIELQPMLAATLQDLTVWVRYTEVFAVAGAMYRLALEPSLTALRQDMSVRCAAGGQGGQLAALFAWLWDRATVATVPCSSGSGRTEVRFRGRTIAMNSAEVLTAARQALDEDGPQASSYQTWYVPIDDHRVSPKWLVHHITGLPVSAFGSGEARRALERWGVEVRHA